jgi:trehalose 6-phosphate synthase
VERLIVVSNRVAVPSRRWRERAGGLAVAIHPVLRRHPGIWFGWSGEVAAASDVGIRAIEHGHQTNVLTDLAEDDFHEY